MARPRSCRHRHTLPAHHWLYCEQLFSMMHEGLEPQACRPLKFRHVYAGILPIFHCMPSVHCVRSCQIAKHIVQRSRPSDESAVQGVTVHERFMQCVERICWLLLLGNGDANLPGAGLTLTKLALISGCVPPLCVAAVQLCPQLRVRCFGQLGQAVSFHVFVTCRNRCPLLCGSPGQCAM